MDAEKLTGSLKKLVMWYKVKELKSVIVKTCSDICFPIVQKNCPMFALKLRNFHHSHNRMGFYPSHSVL